MFCESVFHDEQTCIKEGNLFALNFEGIENVRLAAKSSFYKEHGGKGGDIIVNSSSGERFDEQVPTSSFSHDFGDFLGTGNQSMFDKYRCENPLSRGLDFTLDFT